MKQFIGYTYNDTESAKLASMGFIYARVCDENANNGLGAWIYFYRGKQLKLDKKGVENLYE